MNIRIVFIIALILITVSLAIITVLRKDLVPFKRPPNDNTIYCTLDAKICPDGSYVGRIPPRCDFAPCPGEPGSRE